VIKDRMPGRRLVAALAAGILVGATMVSPAGAHITSSVSHVVKHMQKFFFTKSQSDARYVRSACPGGMVKVGPTCIDRYEASVWSAPTGGVQYGVSSDDYPCDDNGQDCVGEIYARSVPGVAPSRFITWFQAQQALANSGKRLPTNAEWQMAVAGTPDSTDCNVSTGSVANTGVNANCVSDWGANDMVGNLWEWVADWDEQADACDNWGAGYGSDQTCFGDGTPSRFPGAFFRGGDFGLTTSAGPFAVVAFFPPSHPSFNVGFRGAS
jgi:hypothetical protein